MAIASCPYLLDFTSVVSRNSSNCIAILGCGSISVKLYPALPSGGGGGVWMPSAMGSNIVAWGCVLDGAYWEEICKALMYVFDRRHEYSLSHRGAIYDFLPTKFYQGLQQY